MGIFKNTLQNLQGGQYDYLDNQEMLLGNEMGHLTVPAVHGACVLPLFQLFHHSPFPAAVGRVQTGQNDPTAYGVLFRDGLSNVEMWPSRQLL